MSTIFQQNLRKKAAYDPDAEFQDGTPDTYDPPAPAKTARPAVTQLPVVRESLIAADLTISGRVEGKGNVRIAGHLEGDLHIQGDLTVNQGAQLKGTLRAQQVTLAGMLEGNIESAEKVELLDSAVLIGDLKTNTLTIAAGSRVRGTIQCGWNEERAQAESTPEPEPVKSVIAPPVVNIGSNVQMSVSIPNDEE